MALRVSAEKPYQILSVLVSAQSPHENVSSCSLRCIIGHLSAECAAVVSCPCQYRCQYRCTLASLHWGQLESLSRLQRGRSHRIPFPCPSQLMPTQETSCQRAPRSPLHTIYGSQASDLVLAVDSASSVHAQSVQLVELGSYICIRRS